MARSLPDRKAQEWQQRLLRFENSRQQHQRILPARRRLAAVVLSLAKAPCQSAVAAQPHGAIAGRFPAGEGAAGRRRQVQLPGGTRLRRPRGRCPESAACDRDPGPRRREPPGRRPAMLSFAPNIRIFLHARPTDMRNSFDGLCGLVRSVLQADPLDGSLFLFVNRRGDRLKMLWWDRDGLALFYKRLESGTFEMLRPEGEAAAVELDATRTGDAPQRRLAGFGEASQALLAGRLKRPAGTRPLLVLCRGLFAKYAVAKSPCFVSVGSKFSPRTSCLFRNNGYTWKHERHATPPHRPCRLPGARRSSSARRSANRTIRSSSRRGRSPNCTRRSRSRELTINELLQRAYRHRSERYRQDPEPVAVGLRQHAGGRRRGGRPGRRRGRGGEILVARAQASPPQATEGPRRVVPRPHPPLRSHAAGAPGSDPLRRARRAEADRLRPPGDAGIRAAQAQGPRDADPQVCLRRPAGLRRERTAAAGGPGRGKPLRHQRGRGNHHRQVRLPPADLPPAGHFRGQRLDAGAEHALEHPHGRGGLRAALHALPAGGGAPQRCAGHG